MKIKRQKDLYDVNNHLYEYRTWNRLFDRCQEFVQCPFKDPLVIIKEIISWLFKDTIVTMTCLNFDHVQPYSKKWPKKIKLAQMKFFLKKQLIKFLCTYESFHCAKFYSGSRVMRMHRFGAENGPFAPNKIFFLEKNINILFIYLLAPFIVQNFKKILPAGLELRRCAIFGPNLSK